MDFKRHSLSDHFPFWTSSPKGKVVSGLGLGIVVFLMVLSVVVLNVSLKTPLFSPVFHGINSTHLLTWPFSLSSSNFSSSSSYGSTRGPILSNQNLTGSEKGKIEGGMAIFETHEVNASEIDSTGKNMNSEQEDVVLGKTHVGDLSENVQNRSFVVEEGKVQEKSHELRGSEVDKNGNAPISYKQGNILGDFAEEANNSSLTAAGGIAGEAITEGKHGVAKNGSSSANNTVSTEYSNSGKVKFSEKQGNTLSGHDSQTMKVGNSSLEKCDIFDGRWARDDTKPYYPRGSCPYIDKDFDCHLNGRPDDGFLRWNWQPNGCEIPSLNATDFLERLRGKKLVFVGDSLNRNMWESLVCILRHGVKDKKRVFEISGKTEFKKKGFYAFRFEDYNCSVDFVGSPFLVRESTFIGTNGSFETLRLDLMDQSTSMYHDADVIIFNTGHWWTHEKTSRGEDYYQEGNYVYPRLKVLEAYKRALLTWSRWVDNNIDINRTLVIFRGYSVTHFRGGPWNSGGQCHKETEPIFNRTYLAKYPSKMRALEHVLQEMKTPIVYLNISRLTDYRKDGHPSIYRREYNTLKEQNAAVHSQDCSHWCLPGIPDTWNELLYASLLKAGIGSWRT